MTPVFTGPVLATSVSNAAREHGRRFLTTVFTRDVDFGHPCSRAVDTAGPRTRPVDTGSVYRALDIYRPWLVPIIIRPHRSTTYVDTAYCYRRSVVCRSVCHDGDPCKNGC